MVAFYFQISDTLEAKGDNDAQEVYTHLDNELYGNEGEKERQHDYEEGARRIKQVTAHTYEEVAQEGEEKGSRYK